MWRMVPVTCVAWLCMGLLQGCLGGASTLPEPCHNPKIPEGGAQITVYFGCGCFWHVQHAFVLQEMTELCRDGKEISARTAYAGSLETSNGLVCYHNWQNKADYGALGHAEAVQMTIPEASFPSFAENFWKVCPGGERRDWQDVGGEYRSMVGLPGGISSKYAKQLGEAAGAAKLVAGVGNEGDNYGEGVLVYDAAIFPAHVAEKYHQFHDDMSETYGSAYDHFRDEYAEKTNCPGDGTILFG